MDHVSLALDLVWAVDCSLAAGFGFHASDHDGPETWLRCLGLTILQSSSNPAAQTPGL